MKYWIITTEYPPQFGGGIGTYCYQWGRQLIKEGTEVTVFIANRELKGYREKLVDGVRVVEFSPYFEDSAAYLGYETMVSLSFERILHLYIKQEGAPGWIESQEYNGIAYFLLQKKHLGYEIYRDVNVVINCHCPSFIALEYNRVSTYQLPHFWIGEMEKFCIRAADICISPSQYLVDIMLKRDACLKRQYDIVRNPLQSAIMKPVPGNKRSPGALFLGKLSPIKGIFELLKAFSQLWDEGSSYILTLAGDEHYYYHAIGSMTGAHIRKKYQKYISQGLLVLLGNVNPAALEKHIDPAGFIVLPSEFDNFPYALLEVMARHKLVLASDAGGHSEILKDGVNALVYRSGDVGQLKEKIRMAFLLQDEDVARIGANAAATVQEHCDPATYFKNKMAILGSYHISTTHNSNFPFLRVGSANGLPATASGTQKKGLLSVVVPFYNMGGYIHDTIASIDASAYADVEIIIVDDGSNEQESLDVLEGLRNRENVTIVQQKNTGLALARNKGAEHAHGEYLAFVDADDKVAPEYFSAAINILQQKQNVHFVGCWLQYFGGSGNTWPTFTPEPPYLLFHNMVNSSGLVYRRSSFACHGLNDPGFEFGMEDYDSVINMVKNDLGGVVIPELYFHYRVRKDSMSRNFNKSNMSYLYQRLAEKHKSFYTAFATEINNLHNANGPGYNYENPTTDYHLYSGGTLQKKILRKLIARIKRHPQLRRLALNFYKRIN